MKSRIAHHPITQGRQMFLADMTWPDFHTHAGDGCAIVPVGAVEPHGPRLPLGADTMISDYFASRLAGEIGGWIAPTIGYGVATPPQRLGGEFPGVVAISGSTLTSLVAEVLTSLAGQGVRRFVIVNSAIDNTSFLSEAAHIVVGETPDARVMIVSWWEVVGEDFRNDLALETGIARNVDHHAGMVESSLAMHIAPATIRPAATADPSATATVPRRIAYHVFPLPPNVATASGIVYTDAKASAEIGGRVADQVARELADAVRLEFGDSLVPSAWGVQR